MGEIPSSGPGSTPEHEPADGAGSPSAGSASATSAGSAASAGGAALAGGFASGGAADAMPPGPQLAALTEDAWQRGLDRLTDDELIGVLRAARRLASRAAALELSAVGDLAARRRAAPVRLGEPSAGEHVDAEIAAALTLTTRSAAVVQDLALGMTRLPGTLKALAAGRIDQPRAAVIASGTCALDDKAAGIVSALVIRAASGQTTGQLRASVQQVVMWLDPEAARRRKEAAQKQARVELWREPTGTCTLAGRDLPPGFALAADKHLTAAAQWLKEHGNDGSIGQLRAKAFMILLNGQPVIPSGPGGGGAAQEAADAPGGCQAGGGPGAGEGVRAGGGERAGGGPPALAGSVNLILPLTTWLGWSQIPGQVPGFGPVDAQDSRTLAAMLARHSGTKWCLTLTNQEGHAVAHGCAASSPGQPPSSTARWDSAPPRGKGPPGGSGPPEGSGPPGGNRPPGGKGPPGGSDPPGGSGPPRGDHLTWDSRPQGKDQSGTDPLGAWLSRMTVHSLTGPCDHAQATPGYRPSRLLRHLARVRHQNCTRPGCRRPAGQCDLDHTVPYDQGGLTCLCNIGPACRRDHHCKQAPGWGLTQSAPGYLTWTTPAGRTYTTGPTTYLA